jgi:hypothetical protein
MSGVTTIGGLRVLFVMATEQEYGPHLRQQIAPLVGVWRRRSTIFRTTSVRAGSRFLSEPLATRDAIP